MRALAITLALCAVGCARTAIDRTLGWRRLTTEHVQLVTDADAAVALAAVMQLEAHDRALAHVFPDCPDEGAVEPYSVLALSHGDDFDAVRPNRAVGGFNMPVELEAPPAPETVVLSLSGSQLAPSALQAFAHQLAHRLVASCVGDTPGWLQEGLATYFETLRTMHGQIVTGVAPFHFTFAPRTWTAAADGLNVVDVDRRTVEFPTVLEGEDSFYADDEAWLGWHAHPGRYPAAWTVVHMLMLDGPSDVTNRLPGYLAAVAAGDATSFQTAFANVAINRAFHRYLHDAQITEHAEPYEAAEPSPPAVAEIPPAEADLVWMRLLVRPPSELAHDELAEHFSFASEQSETHVRAVLLASRAGLADASALRASDPTDLDVLYARAQHALDAGDDPQALDALLARPDLRIFDLAMAARLASRIHHDDVALALARNVVHLAPGEWWTHDLLGHVLIATAHRDEGDLELRRARRSHAHWWGRDD